MCRQPAVRIDSNRESVLRARKLEIPKRSTASPHTALIPELRVVAKVIGRTVTIGPILFPILLVQYIGTKLAERLVSGVEPAAEQDGSVPPHLFTAVFG